MTKGTKNKKAIPPKKNIQDLKDSRNGGQVALKGYSYQLLLSCYLILSNSDSEVTFRLEGVEDIDRIEQKKNNCDVTYIQAKHYSSKQDASVLSDVLKNFVEAYLLDQNSAFKLVYDFPVATGNLSKLFQSNLDQKSKTYWSNVITKIQENTPSWNWSVYDFDQFFSRMSFEKIEKATLASKIEKALIETYEITTDNISLFANSIKILCLEKMEQGGCISKEELDKHIHYVLDDISKGPHNPAHSWIRKLDYSISDIENKFTFFEGKRATPSDIAGGLPVRRVSLEQEIAKSIQENTITVIKASSGQGKTTLALQVAYNLRQEYTPYQLTWCNDVKELGNITHFFKTRIILGEKPLIVIDNLDGHLAEWNHLAQLLQSELHRHYKLLITTRENDWYNYSGDLSNIQSLKIIKPLLEENEAAEIFNAFKESKQLHPGITSWQQAWNKVADRQLLIEYVFLLTHGEMLSERITSQMSEIGRSTSGKAKCEILRKVCFADICGIKIPVAALFSDQSEDSGADFGELLKGMESEFLVHVNNEIGYIEGLHPIRSMHIVERLHEFISLDSTALSVIEIAKKEDYPVLFSHLPEYNLYKIEFFNNIIEKLWNKEDLSSYISIIQGLFSGSVMQYFRSNQSMFDDANSHGGLFIVSTEICPFTTFKEFGTTVEALDTMHKIFSDNSNIKYLGELRDKMPLCDLPQTAVYTFSLCLYRKLSKISMDDILDLDSYAIISEWIYNIDESFNLSNNFSLNNILIESDKLSLDAVSTLMFVSFCGNKNAYEQFVNHNLDLILSYLKHKTKSHKLYINYEKNAIHVEYILRLSDIKSANEQSVSRLKYICKTLPIFDFYCSDAIKPSFALLYAYKIPDDAHKEMPIRNIVIMFRQNLASLWNKTIMSNYEFETVAEWMDYWLYVRQLICTLADKFCNLIFKALSGKASDNFIAEIEKLRKEFSLISWKEKLFPKEDRPFEDKAKIPEGLVKTKNDYFQNMQYFNNQFSGFMSREYETERLALINLTIVQNSLADMQHYFTGIAIEFGFQERNSKLCTTEKQSLAQLMMYCAYYKEHSPNKFFNKYQIRDWYENQCKNQMEVAEHSLSSLLDKFSVSFPHEIYAVKSLKHYPIIINDLDFSSRSTIIEVINNSISFADSSFDYLVIISSNNQRKIYPSALQIPKQTFKTIRQSYETENDALLKDIFMPFPVDVTAQMLYCFSEKYILPEKESHESLPVGDIIQELWVYSKSRELLTDPDDSEYCTKELQDIQNNIEQMLRSLEGKIPLEDAEQLSDVARNVFNGGTFNDESFNELVEQFAQNKPSP